MRTREEIIKVARTSMESCIGRDSGYEDRHTFGVLMWVLGLVETPEPIEDDRIPAVLEKALKEYRE